MHDPEKSDSGIVATKPTNKAGRPAAELVEPRPGTKGNADQQTTHFRTHPVVDALWIISVAARDAGLEIEDACVRLHAAPFLHSRAPNFSEIQGPGNRAVRSLC